MQILWQFEHLKIPDTNYGPVQMCVRSQLHCIFISNVPICIHRLSSTPLLALEKFVDCVSGLMEQQACLTHRFMFTGVVGAAVNTRYFT
jgi:hypothetical protein